MAKLSLLQIFGLILQGAENFIPVVIHNPKSQAIEGVVMTDVNTIFSELLQLNQQQAATTTESQGATAGG